MDLLDNRLQCKHLHHCRRPRQPQSTEQHPPLHSNTLARAKMAPTFEQQPPKINANIQDMAAKFGIMTRHQSSPRTSQWMINGLPVSDSCLRFRCWASMARVRCCEESLPEGAIEASTLPLPTS